ncbi:MAG TPA: hypothetical protein VMJ31_11510, partial [Methylocystis sp.]|nr:hypothetical protein [Methylocystis sp.]
LSRLGRKKRRARAFPRRQGSDDCASMLFLAPMAMHCGAKSCVDISDFSAANVKEFVAIDGKRLRRGSQAKA